MASGDSWDEQNRRPRRGRRSRPERRPRKVRSGAVTGLAILSMLAGALELVVGLCGLGANAFAEGRAFEAPGLPGIGGNRIIGWLLVLIVFSWGLLAMTAGFGLLFRGGWARLLALMLGAFAALVGFLYGTVAVMILVGFRVVTSDNQSAHVVMGALGCFFFLGYGIVTYAVLLYPGRVEEFR
jgi:hypothetical protein